MWVIFKEQLFLFMCWPKGGEKEGKGAGCWGWLTGSGWPAQSSCHWPLANDSVSVRSTLGSCCRSDGVRLFVGENFQGRAKTWSGQFIDSALWASSPWTTSRAATVPYLHYFIHRVRQNCQTNHCFHSYFMGTFSCQFFPSFWIWKKNPLKWWLRVTSIHNFHEM